MYFYEILCKCIEDEVKDIKLLNKYLKLLLGDQTLAGPDEKKEMKSLVEQALEYVYKENKADIDDIPQSVKKQLNFILLEKAQEALKYALEER